MLCFLAFKSKLNSMGSHKGIKYYNIISVCHGNKYSSHITTMFSTHPIIGKHCAPIPIATTKNCIKDVIFKLKYLICMYSHCLNHFMGFVYTSRY